MLNNEFFIINISLALAKAFYKVVYKKIYMHTCAAIKSHYNEETKYKF